MKLPSKYICLIALGCVFTAAQPLQCSEKRVTSVSARNGDGWRLASPDGFVVYSLLKPTSSKKIQEPVLSVSSRDGTVFVNDIDTRTTGIRITPIMGKTVCAGVTYVGDLIIRCDGDQLSLTHYAAITASVEPEVQVQPKKEAPNKMRKKKRHKDRGQKEEVSPLRQGFLPSSAETATGSQKEGKEEQVSSPEKKIADTLQTSQIKTSTGIREQGTDVDKLPLQESSYKVRVKLDERDLPCRNGWKLVSKKGFFLLEGTDETQSVRLPETEMLITAHGGALYLNGTKYSRKKVYIVPADGAHINFDGNSYQGAFLVTEFNGKLLLINSLDLEDYVHSVLRTESIAGWPLEVNKVFAITCRTYAMEKIVSSRASNLPYHIKNTNIHQTYSGAHTCPVRKSAVEETRGVFIAYNKKPILAMFDICCGGIIPARVARYDFAGHPYLARKDACTYCESCKVYNWQVEYSPSKLMSMLKTAIPHVYGIKNVKVTKEDRAGIVQQVTLSGINRNASVSGKKMYSLVKGVKSCCFTIEKRSDSVIIKGRGHGHQMGLCQWGAREMVNQGFDYKEVLDFYYPGTRLMRLG